MGGAGRALPAIRARVAPPAHPVWRRAPVPAPGMAAGGFGTALVSSVGGRERALAFPYSAWPPRGPGSGRGLEAAGSRPGLGRKPRARRRPGRSRCRSGRRGREAGAGFCSRRSGGTATVLRGSEAPRLAGRC